MLLYHNKINFLKKKLENCFIYIFKNNSLVGKGEMLSHYKAILIIIIKSLLR